LLQVEIENNRLVKGKKIMYKKDEEVESKGVNHTQDYFDISYSKRDLAKLKY
jgi:hypothetical protein